MNIEEISKINLEIASKDIVNSIIHSMNSMNEEDQKESIFAIIDNCLSYKEGIKTKNITIIFSAFPKILNIIKKERKEQKIKEEEEKIMEEKLKTRSIILKSMTRNNAIQSNRELREKMKKMRSQ